MLPGCPLAPMVVWMSLHDWTDPAEVVNERDGFGGAPRHQLRMEHEPPAHGRAVRVGEHLDEGPVVGAEAPRVRGRRCDHAGDHLCRGPRRVRRQLTVVHGGSRVREARRVARDELHVRGSLRVQRSAGGGGDRDRGGRRRDRVGGLEPGALRLLLQDPRPDALLPVQLAVSGRFMPIRSWCRGAPPDPSLSSASAGSVRSWSDIQTTMGAKRAAPGSIDIVLPWGTTIFPMIGAQLYNDQGPPGRTVSARSQSPPPTRV